MNKDVEEMELKERATYKEIRIVLNNKEIGRAEIKIEEKELCNFEIFEPFQNKGYGTNALKLLSDKYNIQKLVVKSDNEIAKHIYEKIGFVLTEPSYYNMKNVNNTEAEAELKVLEEYV